MKAFVTGIAGFAGNYLARLLLEEGCEVYGASQESRFAPFLPIDPGAVRYTALDIRDTDTIQELLRRIRPELVFHLAAKSSPSQSVDQPEETYAVNFGGTLALLEAIRLAKIRCRFLFVSSSHVYGPVGDPGGGRVPETAPLRPETPYAASKAAAETAAWQYWKTFGVEAITARAFNHSGPGQPLGFVCPDMAKKVVDIERGCGAPTLEIRGADRQIDFSHVEDVVRGYYKALVNGRPGEIYNICSGKALTVRAIAEGLIADSPKRIGVVSGASRAGTTDRRGIVGDNSRAVCELGWEPSISVSETLHQVMEYWRQVAAAAGDAAVSSDPREAHASKA